MNRRPGYAYLLDDRDSREPIYLVTGESPHVVLPSNFVLYLSRSEAARFLSEWRRNSTPEEREFDGTRRLVADAEGSARSWPRGTARAEQCARAAPSTAVVDVEGTGDSPAEEEGTMAVTQSQQPDYSVQTYAPVSAGAKAVLAEATRLGWPKHYQHDLLIDMLYLDDAQPESIIWAIRPMGTHLIGLQDWPGQGGPMAYLKAIHRNYENPSWDTRYYLLEAGELTAVTIEEALAVAREWRAASA